MKHKLKEDKNIFYLHTNTGEPCICPYKTGVPVQNKFGSLQILNTDCNSLCPHCSLIPNNKLKLHCSTTTYLEYEMLSELEP